MIRDVEIDSLAVDKVGSLLSLAADELAEEKRAAERGITVRKERHFAFKSAYANVFLLLNDKDAGILIKQVCDYMFGGETVAEEETKAVSGYFSAMKKLL